MDGFPDLCPTHGEVPAEVSSDNGLVKYECGCCAVVTKDGIRFITMASAGGRR